MSKKLESFKKTLRHIEARSHMTREKLNLIDASNEEKIEMSVIYRAKAEGVLEAGAGVLNDKEYDILYDFMSELKIV